MGVNVNSNRDRALAGGGDAEGPRLFAFDLLALLWRQPRIAEKQRRQFSSLVARGEIAGDGADLCGILCLVGSGLYRPQRRIHLGHNELCLDRRMQAGLERPHLCPTAPARVVAQRTRDRDAGQGLTTDRAGPEQLPARLRARNVEIDEPAFSQPISIVAAVMLPRQIRPSGRPRAAPKRKTAARNSAVERLSDIEPVVAVFLIVLDQRCDFVPYRAPRRTGQSEPGGKPGRVAEWKIKAEQNPPPARCLQPLADQLSRRVAGRRVDKSLALGIAPAQPDAVTPGTRHIRSAPVDHDENIEHHLS